MKINEKNLCLFATTPPYDYEGFLSKRGEVNKAFQRRYFVLKGNLLFYFEKKGDKEPLGLIIVEGCTIELSEESDQYCFEIAFNGNRTYILSADSQESMETWMKALTCAGYEYKKLMVAELQRQLEEIEGSRNKLLGESTAINSTTPKPPPRRQNPFNRPAPPLPVVNGNNGNVALKPFINGHFGSTAQRPGHAGTAQLGLDNSPVPPPRGMPTTTNTRNEYSVPAQQNIKAVTVLNEQMKSDIRQRGQQQQQQQQQEQQQLPLQQTNNFELYHEKYRQLIMRDVLEYRSQRELKSRPLIEL